GSTATGSFTAVAISPVTEQEPFIASIWPIPPGRNGRGTTRSPVSAGRCGRSIPDGGRTDPGWGNFARPHGRFIGPLASAGRGLYDRGVTNIPASKPNPAVKIGAATFGNALPLALIAGPCALESRAHALETASALREIAGKLGIGLVYKTSFDKANRTSAKSARGIGLDAALPIFAEIRTSLGVPVLTDVHETEQCVRVAEVVDVLQIPAFLCRQTDLLIAAAE